MFQALLTCNPVQNTTEQGSTNLRTAAECDHVEEGEDPEEELPRQQPVDGGLVRARAGTGLPHSLQCRGEYITDLN